MADIDAELLALAGDSSDDEQEQAEDTTAVNKAESPLSAGSGSPAGQRKRESSAKPGPARKKTTNGKKSGRKSRGDDSEEEGEA